ncbi:MAG TPA: SRPBCC domain-containing protein [Gemmataceae bacterium]|nr:SRPBCC domain-containing protein [Gemmataceae bacterium]
MLHFEGDRDLAQPPAELYAKLSDVRFLVQCVPGLESVKSEQPDQAVCVVRPTGFSFVSGTLELTLQRISAVENTSAQMVVTSKGIGSTSEVETGFTLTPHDGGTRLHWTADVKKLGGLLKAVPQGLLKAAAQKIIEDVWLRVLARLPPP